MKYRTTLPLALAAVLLASAAGLAAQGFDRFDRLDRAHIRAEVRREWSGAARERHRLRDEIRRDLHRARRAYRHAFWDSSRRAYREALRDSRRAMREAFRYRW